MNMPGKLRVTIEMESANLTERELLDFLGWELGHLFCRVCKVTNLTITPEPNHLSDLEAEALAHGADIP